MFNANITLVFIGAITGEEICIIEAQEDDRKYLNEWND